MLRRGFILILSFIQHVFRHSSLKPGMCISFKELHVGELEKKIPPKLFLKLENFNRDQK